MNVLVVDDNRLNLAIAKDFLQKYSNINDITISDNPKTTLGLIEQKSIDILLLDIVMPELNGFDVLKLIRSDDKYNDLQIIMFTSLNDTESFKMCFELGASDFINKPINEIEFNARMKAAISAKDNSNHLKSLISLTQNQNDELILINSKLKETQFHLIQADKMAAIGLLSAGIAHEINNPMGFIKSNNEILNIYLKRIIQYVQFITHNTSNSNSGITFQDFAEKHSAIYKSLKIDSIMAELGDMLSETQSGIERVTDIINSLRSFSRTVEEDEKGSFNLKEVINQVILITRNEVKYIANLEIDVSDDIEVYINKGQIGQVLINIIMNATQAIQSLARKDLGKIEIHALKDSTNIYIYIKDDGPGISENNKSKIFEPFFTTKDIGKGTGLGLSISYDIIVNKHEGALSIDSKIGKGTTFIIRLPIKITKNN